MPLTSPVTGVEPDGSFLSDAVTYKVSPRTPIYTPIPGSVSIGADKTITVRSPEGSYCKFVNVGTPTVTNGDKVTAGAQIGYAGDKPLEFTVFDKTNKKKKVEDFLKNTDAAALAVAGGVTAAVTGKDTKSNTEDDKKPKETNLGIDTNDRHVDVTDRAGFRLATGIGLAPFHLTTKAFGLDKKGTQAESVNKKNKEKLISEEIERIKKLMK